MQPLISTMAAAAIMLSSTLFMAIAAAAVPQRAIVVPPSQPGSMTLGYKPFQVVFRSWRADTIADVGKEPLFLTVAIRGPYQTKIVLHVRISGVSCTPCRTQTWSSKRIAIPTAGLLRLTMRTKPWGCGHPVIETWLTVVGKRTPVESWRPPTQCGE